MSETVARPIPTIVPIAQVMNRITVGTCSTTYMKSYVASLRDLSFAIPSTSSENKVTNLGNMLSVSLKELVFAERMTLCMYSLIVHVKRRKALEASRFESKINLSLGS